MLKTIVFSSPFQRATRILMILWLSAIVLVNLFSCGPKASLSSIVSLLCFESLATTISFALIVAVALGLYGQLHRQLSVVQALLITALASWCLMDQRFRWAFMQGPGWIDQLQQWSKLGAWIQLFDDALLSLFLFLDVQARLELAVQSE